MTGDPVPAEFLPYRDGLDHMAKAACLSSFRINSYAMDTELGAHSASSAARQYHAIEPSANRKYKVIQICTLHLKQINCSWTAD